MSRPRKFVFQRVGAIAGLIAPIIGFTSILGAIASYPVFSWTGNALSDLGVISGMTGPLFNFGLIAGGCFAFVFTALGLFNYLGETLVGKLGAEAFLAATVALIGIGIFNESFQGTHYILSVAFFVFAPISMFILTLAFWLCHRIGMAVFTVLIGIAAAFPWILQFIVHYVPNVAVPEATSGLAVSAWVVVLAAKMFKLASKSP
jgi:hypothetical membrane protein